MRLLKAKEKNVEDYLMKNGIFLIPDFQRELIWSKGEREELFNDINYYINNKKEGESFLLGTTITSSNKTGICELVDGQQRTFNLLIIMKVLTLQIESRIKSQEQEVVDLVSKLKKCYIKNVNKKNSNIQIKLRTSDDDSDLEFLFSMKTLGIPKDKIKSKYITSSFNYWKNKIKTIKTNEIVDWANEVLKLKIIHISLGENDAANQIFESTNSKGKQLKLNELAKNHYLYIAQKNYENDLVDSVKEREVKVKKSFSDISEFQNYEPKVSVAFFRTYLFSDFSTIVNHEKSNESFKKLREAIDKKDPIEAIDDLVSLSSFLKEIANKLDNPKKNTDNIFRAIFAHQPQKIFMLLSIFKRKFNIDLSNDSIIYIYFRNWASPISFSSLMKNLCEKEKDFFKNKIFKETYNSITLSEKEEVNSQYENFLLGNDVDVMENLFSTGNLINVTDPVARTILWIEDAYIINNYRSKLPAISKIDVQKNEHVMKIDYTQFKKINIEHVFSKSNLSDPIFEQISIHEKEVKLKTIHSYPNFHLFFSNNNDKLANINYDDKIEFIKKSVEKDYFRTLNNIIDLKNVENQSEYNKYYKERYNIMKEIIIKFIK